jgi:hypothetical protein
MQIFCIDFYDRDKKSMIRQATHNSVTFENLVRCAVLNKEHFIVHTNSKESLFDYAMFILTDSISYSFDSYVEFTDETEYYEFKIESLYAVISLND